jgi:hypothetical protein
MAQTTTIYSTLGPGDSFFDGFRWLVGTWWYSPETAQTLAVEFTPGDDYVFESASFAFTGGYTYPPDTPTTETFNIRLTENLQDGDSALERFSVSVSSIGIYSIYSIEHPRLKAGTTYYLHVYNNNPGYSATQYDTGGWFPNDQGITEPYWFGDPGPPYVSDAESSSSTPAFRVEGSPSTPQQSVELILEDVEALFDAGILTRDQAEGLADKLAAAIQSLDSGKTRSACNQLGAFMNQVRAFVRAHKLSPEEGQSLLNDAEAVIAMTGC